MSNRDIEVEDIEVLVAAQEKAARILSDARREAESLRSDARREADAVLLRQNEIALRLLSRQKTEAAETAESVGRAAYGASAERKAEVFDEATVRAEDLLKRQAEAAEALRVPEESEAAKKREGIEHDATAILMQSHREAAAILLEARMVVEARREARKAPPLG